MLLTQSLMICVASSYTGAHMITAEFSTVTTVFFCRDPLTFFLIHLNIYLTFIHSLKRSTIVSRCSRPTSVPLSTSCANSLGENARPPYTMLFLSGFFLVRNQ